MRGRRVPARLLPLLLRTSLLLALAATACSSDAPKGDAVAITSTATTCEVARDRLAAGKTAFRVENKGDEVLEVYVYADGDRVVAEREGVGPGTRATFSADLAAGGYEIACKPGERGKGIRRRITVG